MNTFVAPAPTVTATVAKTRIASIDLLRGTVMVIMALDHVRDFFMIHNPNPADLSTTTLPLFLTRWITHFCAPIFLLLSGTSAFLSGQRKTKVELSNFLIKRGLWLVFVELCIVTLSWTFDPFYHIFILQVIWAIGWSMVLLGLAVRVSYTFVLAAGLILFFGHNLVDVYPIHGTAATFSLTAAFTFIPFGPNSNRGMFDIYAILPWAGVMFMGYSIGPWFARNYAVGKRESNLLLTGSTMIVLFIVMRWLNTYGDPNPWRPQDTAVRSLISFLNVTKYPVSLIYLFMTLGPALIILALTENAKGAVVRVLSVYGRVPFFYYILHFYLIHTCCVLLFFATGHSFHEAFGPQVLFSFRLDNMGFGLLGVYVVWALIVSLLYFPCRWYDQYKRTHTQWWLSYL